MPRLLPAILCFRPKRPMIKNPAAPWTVTPHCRFRLERKPWFTIRATWDLRPDATTSDTLGRLRDHVLRSKGLGVTLLVDGRTTVKNRHSLDHIPQPASDLPFRVVLAREADRSIARRSRRLPLLLLLPSTRLGRGLIDCDLDIFLSLSLSRPFDPSCNDTGLWRGSDYVRGARGL
jgi:hypothetical protein